MINFDNVKELAIGEKAVEKLYIDAKLVWEKGNINTRFKVDGNWIVAIIIGELTNDYIPSGNLTEVEIGTLVTSIADNVFENYNQLTRVTVPSTVTTIGSGAFAYCSSLSDVKLAKGIERIGSAAFTNCNSLTSIIIPSTVTALDNEIFFNCNSLANVTFRGKTKAQVQGMTNYSWYIPSGCVIHCIDGDITI